MDKVLHNNKKAYADYEIQDTFEAGIVLEGWEVKSLENHQVNLANAFVKNIKDELYLVGMIIPSWKFGDPKSNEVQAQNRKLLLNKREISKLSQAIEQPGLSVIPLKIYRSKRYIKVAVGIAKGRKKYDKRQKLKARDMKRRIEQDLK